MRIIFVLLAFCACASAEIIPSHRLPGGNATNWQNAGMAQRGGIPDSSTMTVYTNCDTGVTLAQLNAVLAAAPSNSVVQLTNGNFSFSGNINWSKRGVVLRGRGATNTFITFGTHAGGNNIQIGSETINRTAPSSGSFILNWTNGFTHGATTLTLSNTAGLPSPGHILVLDQLNDNVWVDDDVQEGCTYCGRDSGERAQAQYVYLVSSNGNDIVISPGLHMPNWRLSMQPQVWGWTAADTTMCGVEDMSITNGAGSGTYCIYIAQSHNCWVKGVNFYGIRTAAIATSQVKNIEARQIGLLSAESASSQSYGVIWYMASDCLLIDSISDSITGTMNFSPQCSGSVVAFNFITNNIYTPSNWNIAGLASHDGHVCMNLLEGNWVNDAFYDSIHGSASHNTDFRNRYSGLQTNRVNNTIAYAAQQYVLSNNVVGNILGTVGYHTNYWVTNLAMYSPGFSSSIFRLGEGNAADGIPWDDRVAPSTLIHGNWDAVNQAQTWDSNIADHSIPDSMGFASKPAWFGFLTWPPYSPTVVTAAGISSTNIPAGYRAAFGTNPPAAIDSTAGPAGRNKFRGIRFKL